MTQPNWSILQPPDIFGQVQQGFQLGQRNALLQQEQARQQEERERQTTLRNALTGAYNPGTGQIDPAAARRAYASVGDIPGAMQFDATRAQTQERISDAQKQQIIIGAQLLDGVTDEAGFQAARQTYARMGLDLTGIPETYDPAYVEQVRRAGRALQSRTQQGQSRPVVIDGVAIDPTTGQPLYESPYDRIIPGQNGSFYRVPRIGIGRGGTGQQRQGQVVQGEGGQLPEGWEPIEDDEGGPSRQDSGYFRGHPVSDGGSVIRSLFPGARITETRRAAGSRLGRANPGSWHVQSGGAVDIAPIPGMTFDQYVQRIRRAGYSIIEARDEVNNPSSHATGPHWHVVIGRSR